MHRGALVSQDANVMGGERGATPVMGVAAGVRRMKSGSRPGSAGGTRALNHPATSSHQRVPKSAEYM